MNSTEIDDALRGEQRFEPSAEFRTEVMRAVHARAAAGRSLDRLWRAVWPVVAVSSVAIALVMAATVLERSEPRPVETVEAVRWLSFTLTGTVAIAWRRARRFV